MLFKFLVVHAVLLFCKVLFHNSSSIVDWLTRVSLTVCIWVVDKLVVGIVDAALRVHSLTL